MRLFLNDKPASVDEICQLLKLKKTDIPFHIKSKNFKRLGFEGKRDVQTKKAVIPRGYGIPNSIDVYLPDGETAKITYAENVRQENVNGVAILQYTPLSTMLPGLELSLKEDQRNLFFYLFIHTYNKQSPLNIGKPNPNLVYEFVDTERAARELEIKEDELLDALNLLKSMGEKEVRQIAKGYKIFGVDDMAEVEVRRLLRAKLKENPSQFIINLDDNEIALEGVIQDAIDKGVINERTVGISKVWSIGDKDIATTQIGSLYMPALRVEVESNMELYFPLLQKGIGETIKAAVLKKPEYDRFFSGFKAKKEEVYSPLEAEDHAVIKQVYQEEAEAQKYRNWYAIDVNDTSIHAGTRKAVIKNADNILAQFAKDKAEGLIPADQPEPSVRVLQTA